MKIPNDMQAGTIHETNNCGELEIVDYINAQNVMIRFIRTGFTAVKQAVHIREGRVKDFMLPSVFGVGFIGAGEFKCSVNGKNTKAYNTWNCMLERCYSKKCLLRCPTYKGCSVCEEWHNFQVFAAWFDDNYIDGFSLDKDIKVAGNKVYCPDTCVFVSQSENAIAARAKHYKFTNPKGEVIDVYNLREFCKNSDLTRTAMSKVWLGKRNHHKQWRKAQ